jgi:pheromone shutdown protein TraB
LGKLDIQRFMMTKPPPELEQFFAENFSRDFKQGVEKLKDRKRIAMMSKYMESAAPEVMKVMLTERDEFMVDSILKSCTHFYLKFENVFRTIFYVF